MERGKELMCLNMTNTQYNNNSVWLCLYKYVVWSLHTQNPLIPIFIMKVLITLLLSPQMQHVDYRHYEYSRYTNATVVAVSSRRHF